MYRQELRLEIGPWPCMEEKSKMTYVFLAQKTIACDKLLVNSTLGLGVGLGSVLLLLLLSTGQLERRVDLIGAISKIVFTFMLVFDRRLEHQHCTYQLLDEG